MTAEKCLIVWNSTVDSDSTNDTVTRRLACPHGWNYDPEPVETSIVTDVSIGHCSIVHCSAADVTGASDVSRHHHYHHHHHHHEFIADCNLLLRHCLLSAPSA